MSARCRSLSLRDMHMAAERERWSCRSIGRMPVDIVWSLVGDCGRYGRQCRCTNRGYFFFLSVFGNGGIEVFLPRDARSVL